MIDNRSKKGRPMMDFDKRNKKIDVRVTEDGYQVILELEKTMGVRKMDLVPGRLLRIPRLLLLMPKN